MRAGRRVAGGRKGLTPEGVSYRDAGGTTSCWGKERPHPRRGELQGRGRVTGGIGRVAEREDLRLECRRGDDHSAGHARDGGRRDATGWAADAVGDRS